MKKLVALLLMALIVFSMFPALSVMAEESLGIVYISENSGADTNDGLTEETPVKSFNKAGEILRGMTSATAWKIIILNSALYDQAQGWRWLNSTVQKPTTVCGKTGTEVFNFTRTAVVLRVPLTFENVVFSGDSSKITSENSSTYPDAVLTIKAPTSAYLSDSGNDDNDGLSALTPKKTYAAALSVLSSTDPSTLYIVDTFTYPSSGAWYFLNNRVARTLTICGVDGSDNSKATLVLDRSSVAFGADYIFDNIAIKSTKEIDCYGKNVLFTDRVTCIPYNGDASQRTQFPIINGGGQTTSLTGGTVVLNGGTFNYAYVASYGDGSAATSKQIFTIGENATVMHSLHLDTTKSFQDVEVNIYGKVGTVGGGLVFGEPASQPTYNGNVEINIFATANQIAIIGADVLNESIAEGKTAVLNFEHNPSILESTTNKLPESTGNTELSALTKLTVKSYDNKPVFVATQEKVQSIRFCATLDTLDYRSVGFHIVANYGNNESKTFDVNCKEVYDSLLGTGKDYQPSEFGAKYYYALSITNLPENLGDVTFTVTPFAKTNENDTVVQGITKVVNANVTGGVVTIAN